MLTYGDSSKPSTYVALQVCRLSLLSLCFRMLTYADVAGLVQALDQRMLTYADSSKPSTYADVCRRMLTYADVC
jgi:hypothetical protein